LIVMCPVLVGITMTVDTVRCKIIYLDWATTAADCALSWRQVWMWTADARRWRLSVRNWDIDDYDVHTLTIGVQHWRDTSVVSCCCCCCRCCSWWL